MPRIKLITDRADAGPERQAEIDAIEETLGQVSGPFGVLMHSPGLAQKVMEAGAQVRLHSTLAPSERELAILGVAVAKRSNVEWASHVDLARKGGVAEDVIEAVRHDEDVSGFAPDVADQVRYVRELVSANRVDQAVFERLVERHGERWLVELTATVGQYQYVACVLGAFEVEPGPGRERILPE